MAARLSPATTPLRDDRERAIEVSAAISHLLTHAVGRPFALEVLVNSLADIIATNTQPRRLGALVIARLTEAFQGLPEDEPEPGQGPTG